jgi:hypothetical protein
MIVFLSAALVPVVWILLDIYVFRKLNKAAHKYLPVAWAHELTKKR